MKHNTRRPYINRDIVNKEANYKINVNRVRSYFMTSTQGPLKLAYENPKGYSQVINADFIVASPEGQKAYCWLHNDMLTNQICADFIDVNNKIIPNIKCPNIPLELVYGGIEGTIFYGTISATTTPTTTPTVFIIEDIFYFQGKYVSHTTWKDKLVLYKHIFTTYPSIFPTFTLPFMCHTLENIRANQRAINYTIKNIQYKRWDSKKTCIFENVKVLQQRNIPMRQQPAQQPLWTKADTKADIYYLYTTAASTEPIGMALIPNYKTSVKMNQLFRNIKENVRLDALEESDDEEEFENIAEDKFMLANKEPILLQYSWHPKFRKYFPVFNV